MVMVALVVIPSRFKVSYYRNSENISVAGNYRSVFHLSSGQYFKWAAHDDICQRQFLAKCVDILE
jgi:hypothetical protein